MRRLILGLTATTLLVTATPPSPAQAALVDCTRSVPSLELLPRYGDDGILRGVDVRGGRQHEILWLVFGLARVDITLPWGGRLLVRPDLIQPLGFFPPSGTLSIPSSDPAAALALGPLAMRRQPMPTSFLVQAFAISTVQGDAEILRSSNELEFPLEQSASAADGDDRQLVLRASVGQMHGTFELDLEVDVESSGYELQLDSLALPDEASGEDTTRAYVRLVKPASHELVLPVLETLRLRVDLGPSPGRAVEIHVTEVQRGQPGPAVYHKRAEVSIADDSDHVAAHRTR